MILITGINGLVGSFVAKHFIDKGFKVAGLIRPKADLSLLKEYKDQITWIEGDVLDVMSLEHAFTGINTVIHCAAVVSFVPKDRHLMYKVNVEGTANVVNECLVQNIKKLVFVSSVAALGKKENPSLDNKGFEIYNEDAKWEESPNNSNYAKTKYLAEMEVWRGVAEGLTANVVNPSVILGEGDWGKSSTQLFKYVYDEKKFYTKGSINYVDAKDVARAIFELSQSEIKGERFILNAGNMPYKDFFDIIAQKFNKKSPDIAVGNLVSQIAWRLEALKCFFTQKKPLITKETAASANSNIFYDNQKISERISFTFSNLEDTIGRVCDGLLKIKNQA
ncbi:MAG: NAD-dependent epimerase/dehydratase family protein [Pseudarcicella sp.]|nr:NAD-dependent epimerase/dehydratase family protein [Pseudarcicella sp.]MBP6411580.1 NAD-dependent epimerase/dehydratase family protein [Pseudarcicella sp.]